MAYKNSNYVGGVKVPYVDPKKVTEKRVKVLEDKLEQIKEACARLKNSSTSKNDALREIKNICNAKEAEANVWREILGDEYEK